MTDEIKKADCMMDILEVMRGRDEHSSQRAADEIEALRTDNATLRTALQNHGEEAARMVENRAAIDELVGALIEARAQVLELCIVAHIPTPEASLDRYDAAIAKHQQPKP
jgi:hypothetical protein